MQSISRIVNDAHLKFRILSVLKCSKMTPKSEILHLNFSVILQINIFRRYRISQITTFSWYKWFSGNLNDILINMTEIVILAPLRPYIGAFWGYIFQPLETKILEMGFLEDLKFYRKFKYPTEAGRPNFGLWRQFGPKMTQF